MKFGRKMAIGMIAALVTASLSGCGGSNTASNAGGQNAQESTAAVSEVAKEISLPLTAEKKTLTFFQQLNDNSVISKDYNDVEAFQELENRTNVHIDWQLSSSADFQTNFNLMIASNQTTDIMAGANYYQDGLDAGVEDGYFLDLTDIIAQNAPHYYALANSSETFRIKTKTDSGKYIALYPLMQDVQGPWCGLMIRQDWLDELGLDMPVTFEDWHTVLKAFKDEKGCSAPLSLTAGGYRDLSRSFMAGFGAGYDWQITEDGTVAYGPYLDGWREYVTMMHQWYQEGLIDPDFMTAGTFVDTTYVVTGKTGAFIGIDSMAPVYEQSSSDSGMKLAPVTPPVKNAGDETHLRLPDQVFAGTVFAIGANCKEPELALQWVDYLNTEEGAILANYGILDDTFTQDEEGYIYLSDKILADPKLSPVQAQYTYCMAPNAAPFYYDWTRGLLLNGNNPKLSLEESNPFMTKWMSVEDDWVMPAELTLTAEESTERASIMTDIESYMRENTTAMISGTVDIDANWDNYKNTIKSLGIERATEITQAAYDRYLSR